MRTLIITTLILGMTNLVCSQATTKTKDKISLGFNIGTNYSLIKAQEKPLPNNAEISNNFGYQMGIIAEYNFSDRLSLNPRIEVVFNNGTVLFPNASEEQQIHEILPVSLNLMTYLIYRVGDRKNRPYLLLGPDVKLPHLEKVRSTLVFSSTTDIAIDAGIGFDITSNRYTYSPEFRYSYGLTTHSHPYLQSLKLHSISLVLNVL